MASAQVSTKSKFVFGNSFDTVPLSNLFRDPLVRRAFERAERDDGAAFAIPAPKPAPGTGGAVRELVDG